MKKPKKGILVGKVWVLECFNFCISRHITEFLWGIKKLRDRSLNIYRNYSLTFCCAAAQVSLRLREPKKQVFIKSLVLGKGLKKKLFLMGKVTEEASLIMHIMKNSIG